MALTSPVQPWYIKKFVGMNSRIEDNEMSVEHSVLSQNARFEVEPGAIDKRDPVSYYNATLMNDPALNPTPSAFRWFDGTKSILMASNGSKMFVGNDTTGVMTEIRSGLTEGKFFNFVVYNNQVICGNGYDNLFVYDGTNDNVTWELGACKAVTAAGGTNLDASAAYYYAVTFDDDAYVCGAVSNTVTTGSAGGNRKVSLSNIPVGPTGTTNRKIYRTEGGGSSLKLLTTISDNTTTTYTDDTADGSLGAAMPAVTDDMPKGNLLQIHRERFFLSGDPNSWNKIYYSEPYLPHYIQHVTNARYMEVGKDDGDEIMGIPISLGVMVCIKRNSFRKLHITTPTSGASPDSWYADDPVQNVGTPAKRSILSTPFGIFFLSRDGWYLWDGTKAQPVIDEFDTDNVLESDFINCVSHYHPSKDGLILLAYTDSATSVNYKNRQMVYNWKRQAMSVDTLFIGCYAGYNGKDANELFYGDSRKGYIYIASNADKYLTYSKKSEIEADDSHSNTNTLGTEDDPYIVCGRSGTIDEMVGTINAQVGTIDILQTTGTVTFASQQLNVGAFGKFYWNVLKYHSSDTVTAYLRTGASQVACEAAAWGTGMTESNGSTVGATPNVWVQFKFDFSLNSTAGSARIYKTDGFVIKLLYKRSSGSIAESSVEFIHTVGNRNFDAPDIEKIFKKITANHSGTGTYTITWTTENATGSFTIDMATNPSSWSSFFPSNAFGSKLNIQIYKSDLSAFKLKELKGLYTPEPIIV
jgi:hypothetical protein